MGGGNYWSRAQRRASSRRRFLGMTAAGGVGLAAMTLAACGGSSGSSSSSKNTAGNGGGAEGTQQAGSKSILTPRVDQTSQAVKGGIIQLYTTADVANLDPLAAQSFTGAVAGSWVYPRLLQYKPGLGDKVPTGEVEQGIATKWEQVEPTKLVLTIRDNAKWDPRAPTNSRPLDADDIIFSWKKFQAKSISRQDFAHSANPTAPVDSITKGDGNTIVVNAAFPSAALLTSLAYANYLEIEPREADGGFDPAADMRGAGPWMLTNYTRSVKFEYRRNPNYWRTDVPFADGFDFPIIAEYSAGLAQFKAKKVWAFAVRQEDIIDTKNALPELSLYKGDYTKALWGIYFGLKPDSPFRDARVRQALSMLIDRDAWIDAFYNVSTFKKAGYPAESRWNSHIASGWEGIWLDPQGKDLGDGAKNFQYNPGEAKKLLSAAGYPNGIDTTISYISTPQYGTTFPKMSEVFKGMFEQGGLFKLKTVNPDYNTEYLPKIYFGKGNFDGIAVGAFTLYPDIGQYLLAYYHSKGAREKTAFMGQDGDAQSDALIEKQNQELDNDKRVGILKDWQRYMATQMDIIPFPGYAPPFVLVWPWIGNYGWYRNYGSYTEPQDIYPFWWFDKSKYTG